MGADRIVVERRIIADPNGLGFAAFAATTYIASVHATGERVPQVQRSTLSNRFVCQNATLENFSFRPLQAT